MKKILFAAVLSSFIFYQDPISAHCQMPCGIYHDAMVYDQIDQYVETMVKAMAMLNDSKFSSARDRNEFTRWVITKEEESDNMAQLITKYFLQQKIKPGEDDTNKRLDSAHKLLFLLVQIKQTVDVKFVRSFAEEWDKFKRMFHVENYECEVGKAKIERLFQKAEDKLDQDHDHNHDDNHNHDHGQPKSPKK